MRRKICYMGRYFIALATLLIACFASYGTRAGETVDAIRARGYINCGVTDSQLAFAGVNEHGRWTGFDVDFCRAIAAALLNNAEQVTFLQLGPTARFDAIKNKEIDVLFRNTTWTLSRDTLPNMDFTSVIYYDGQGFMGRRSLQAKRVDDIKDKKLIVCVVKNTTSYDNVVDYINTQNLPWKIKSFKTFDGGHRAFFKHLCDLYTTDMSALVSMRAYLANDPSQYVLLEDSISREPLGPMMLNIDPQWYDIVKWVIQAVILAEEAGVTSANVDQLIQTTGNPEIKRLLGITPGAGKGLGLDDKWAYRVINQVGNYGEIFARNLGPDTPMNLKRGLNAIWTQGGLHYAYPFR